MFSFLGFSSAPQQVTSNNEPTDKSTDSTNEDAPMFPSPNSIQRASTSSTSTNSTPSFEITEPDEEEEEVDDEIDGILGSFPLDDIDSLPPPISTVVKPPVPRKKVRLQPGFSQLDWARLKSSGANLKGEEVFSIRRISREELSQHNKKDDAWSCFHGRVYNITPYLNYHPGGPRELMRVAGKDGTELFMKTHAWVSADGMMDSCLVGFLVNH